MSTSPTQAQPLPLVIGGSIAIDHIKTPQAEGANLLGGSACFAAIAASFHTSPVHLVGIVGADFPQEHLDLLARHGVTLEGIERSEGSTFSWSGEYHENMNERTTHKVAVNVLEGWKVKVPEAIAGAPLAVLANMSPDNQLEMLDQLRAPAFVMADTMDLWISIANERLHEVLKRIDLFVINESEAREFCGTSNLIVAGRRLLEKGPRHVVVKLGEFGSILFSREDGAGAPAGSSLAEGGIRLFRCAALPLGDVADPTGAGDSFLGALAGHLASTGKRAFDFDDIRQGVVHGSVAASFTCEAFSTHRLQEISRAELDARHDFLKSITHWP